MDFMEFLIAEEGLFSGLRERKEMKEQEKEHAKEVYKNPENVVSLLKKAADYQGIRLASGPEAERELNILLTQYNNNPGVGKHRTASEFKRVSGIPLIISYRDHDKGDKTFFGSIMYSYAFYTKKGHLSSSVTTWRDYKALSKL